MNFDDLIDYIRNHGPVSALTLCEHFGEEYDTVKAGLTELLGGGVLKRGILLTPNGTSRATLGIGWSCQD